MLSFLAQKDFESIFSNKLFCKNILNWSKQTDTNAIIITKIRVQTTASSTPPRLKLIINIVMQLWSDTLCFMYEIHSKHRLCHMIDETIITDWQRCE